MTWTPPVSADVVWLQDTSGATRASIFHLARELYSLLCRPLPQEPGEPDEDRYNLALHPGVGIPVKLGRSLETVVSEIEGGAGASENVRRIVIVLLDEVAHLHGADGFAPTFERLIALAGQRAHLRVFPAILHPDWARACGKLLGIAPDGDGDEERAVDARRQVGVDIARWLSPPGEGKIRVLVSYARRDLPAAKGARRKGGNAGRRRRIPSATDLNDFLARHTRLYPFLDTKDLTYGEDITAQLRSAGSRSILLSIRTDRYSESWWCQEEMLTAKELHLPIVAVSIQDRGQQRSSPYGGNVLELVGREKCEAQIFDHIVRVWLQHVHFRIHGQAVARLVDLPVEPVLLSRPPELLDFALGVVPARTGTLILYPDPPVSTHESQILSQAYPKSRPVTPTTLFGRLFRPDDPVPPLTRVQVAISLSSSPDAPPAGQGFHAEGFGAWHVDAAIAHVALCLIRTGAAIAYGGHISPTGYTRFLADLLRAHNQLGANEVPPLRSFVAADYVGESIVPGLPGPKIIGKHIDGPARTPRQLVEMRRAMAKEHDARVVLGGRVLPRDAKKAPDGYQGRFPGLLEECHRTLQAGKPLYLIAGFGGASRKVADILLGKPAGDELTEAHLRREFEDYDALCEAYDGRTDLPEDDPRSVDEMVERVRAFGGPLRGPDDDALWSNGLTAAENRRLFESREPAEIAHLVVKGLIHWRAAQKKATPPRLSVRLYHGNTADAPGVQAYAVALFEGVGPTGDEAVLDERFGGEIRRVAERGEWPESGAARVVPAPGARLAGDWAVLASLGKLGEATEMSARVDRAYARLFDCAARYGLQDIAIAPLGLTAGCEVDVTLGALVERLRATDGGVTLTICAADKRHHERILALLDERKADIDRVDLPADPLINMRPAHESPVTLHLTRDGKGPIRMVYVAPADQAGPLVPALPRTLAPHEEDAIERMRSSETPPRMADQEEHGRLLASLLPPPMITTLLREPERPLDIIHDAQMAGIPWELLRIQGDGQSRLPAIEGGIRRRVLVSSTPEAPPHVTAPASSRRALVIVDPTGDLAGAAKEGDELQSLLEKLPGIQARFLRGSKATIRAVQDALKESWDAVHYAGHAEFVPEDHAQSGLVLADGVFVARHLKESGALAPPLMFLNACESARVRGPGPLPVETHAPLAEGLLRAGVQTLIGNFWLVGDLAARTAALSFYPDVIRGRPFGKALQRARKILLDQGSPHWSNYMLYGDAERRW